MEPNKELMELHEAQETLCFAFQHLGIADKHKVEVVLDWFPLGEGRKGYEMPRVEVDGGTYTLMRNDRDDAWEVTKAVFTSGTYYTPPDVHFGTMFINTNLNACVRQLIMALVDDVVEDAVVTRGLYVDYLEREVEDV